MAIEDGYAICFNEWALDKNIKCELGLLLIISGLTAEQGFCFAKNKYFAELFNESEDSISRKIKKLESLGYLTIKYEKRGGEITNRYIMITRLCQNSQDSVVPRTTKMPVDEPQNCRSTNHNFSGRYNIYKNTIDNITIPKKGISNKNTNILENNIKSTPNQPRVSAPQVQAGSRLPNKVKAKLLDFDSNTRKVLENYCLFLIDTYNLPERSLLNRIDDVRIKARNVNSAIEAICNYNINGGYKTLYVPGNLSKIVAETVVISEEASDDDFVRDADGNIEEIW